MVVADEIISEGSSSGSLHAESRSFLYQSVDNNGNIASSAPGYDSVSRLLQYQRGTLASTGGYESAGGGSITAPITLPNTDANRTYNLDGLGNWKTSVYTPVGGSATTDQRNHNYVNEITQRTLAGRSPVVFQYDGATGGSNGNLKNDGTLIYAYDALNSPIQINRVSDGLVIATYVYDAMNRRVRKTILNGGLTGNVPNSTTDYIWSGSQVVEERNAGNTPIRQYVWGTYIDELIQPTTLVPIGPQNLSPGPYYLLQDLLYRAVALTNSSGDIVETYDTDAYGNTLIFTGPGADGVWFTDDDVQSSYGANEIIYCGYPENKRVSTDIGTGLNDPENELYYVRNRTYNPVLGRWIQRDPIGYAGGVNLYEYVSGSAVVAVDPEGNLPGWIWFVDPKLAYHEFLEMQAFCNHLKQWCAKMVGSTRASCETVSFCAKESRSCGFPDAVGLTKALVKITPLPGVPPGVGTMVKKVGKAVGIGVVKAIKHGQ